MDTEKGVDELTGAEEVPNSEDGVNTERCDSDKQMSAAITGECGKPDLVESGAGDEVSEPGDSSKPGDDATKEESGTDTLKENSALGKTSSTKPKDGNDSETGIDHEMEAMFGESSGKSDDTSQALRAPEDKSDGQDDDKKTDESNLEVMLEKMHADKICSPLKPKESTGMELSDVLQALTEDDPSESKKKEITKKGASKPCPKSKKKSVEASESESGNETAEKRTTRSTLAVQSSGKKKAKADESSESEGEKDNSRSLRNKRSDQSSLTTRRKTEVKDESSESEDENTDKKKEVAKRGRGRPRKQQNLGKESVSKADEEKVVKHLKVGKKKVEGSSDDEKSSKPNEKSSLLKKGRGRPRKRPLDGDETEEKAKSKTVGKEKTPDEEQTGDSSDASPGTKGTNMRENHRR